MIDFSDVPIASTVAESRALQEARRVSVLAPIANIPLPVPVDEDNNTDTNPRMDSRCDVRLLTDRATARILLGMDTSEVASVFLDPTTKAFGVIGTSLNKYDPNALCERPGDYDFVLMNLLRLVYVARANPGSFPEAATQRIISELLTVSGNDYDGFYTLNCRIRNTPMESNPVTLVLGDTENHVLMANVAQYLTNQLLSELPEYANEQRYNNALNGNDEHMLEYLSEFLVDMFYEYNSRPYQGYTVIAFEVLHDYAHNEKVATTAGMVLDLISGWSAVQSNQLRKFSPFRRQPKYIEPQAQQATNPEQENSEQWQAWSGETESERLALLAGNYGYLEAYEFTLPDGDGKNHFAVTAAVSNYRMDDALLDIAIREDGKPRYFVGNHDTVEMYFATESALISAGGVSQKPELPEFGTWLAKLEPFIKPIYEKTTLFTDELGWAHPTTLIPTRETSSDLRDMIRFEGHKDLKRRENICVAPGFACGLTPKLSRHPLISNCETRQGDWRFFNFNSDSCPLEYGFYMALYERPCDTERCSVRSAENSYGLLEIAEASALSFESFTTSVLANNPMPFSSTGEHTYITTNGHNIQFEIAPPLGISPLIAVDEKTFNANYRSWPQSRGDTIQSTTPGRITLDGPATGKRLILDVTDPLHPQRIATSVPMLRRSETVGRKEGRFFDDGGAVIPGESVNWIGIAHNGTLSGIGMEWRSGLAVFHGADNYDHELYLEEGEYIRKISVGVIEIRCGVFSLSRCKGIGYLYLETNLGNELEAGYAAHSRTFEAKPGEQFVGFHGRKDRGIVGLGAIFESVKGIDAD